MEMTYDGMLVMPSSYAVMDEEEITYVEGGALSFYLSYQKCATIDTYLMAAGVGVTSALGAAAVSARCKAALGKIVSLFGRIGTAIGGVVGTVVGVALGIIAAINLVSFFVNTWTAAKEIHSGVKMSWYGLAFLPNKYY